MIKSLIDRVFLSGYDAAKEALVMTIIGRLSRGNTTVQDPQIIDEEELERLRHEGDEMTECLRRKQRSFARHTA